ncbi:hypothetical protein XENORESO_019228 [Xenotaenia resolanae]|uniref:receptor protein-tyrosine kinase n=1 Tax=Xenotaenia resolanae TaxID=208358 RepID=A0ABV0X3R8_9TELE
MFNIQNILTSHPLCTVQQSRANFHRRTRNSDPVVIPRHVSSVYLNKDQLRRLQFKPTIHSIELSEGHEAKFNCSIDIPDTRLDPSIVWKKNDEDLSSDDHVGINELQSITEGVTTLLSTVMYVAFIKAVQRVDAGEYCCTLSVNSEIRRSESIVLKVEGLPAFTQQPEDLNVTRDTPFTLTCMAEGPPEPVHIRWLHDGLHITDKVMSPYTLYVQGANKQTQFSCEAHNAKGVSTSREANINIKVLPSPVTNLMVIERQSNKLILSWSPGHDGFSPLTKCHIRVKEVSQRKGEVTTTRLVNATVPPFHCEVPGLKAMTCYNMSVSCSNELGASPLSMWIQDNTTEGGYPRNVTMQLNESWLVVKWKPPPEDKINGILTGYDVVVRHGAAQDKAHTNYTTAFVPVKEFNMTYSVEVAACTQAGSGMDLFTVRPTHNVSLMFTGVIPTSVPDTEVPHAVSVILGVFCAISLLLLIIWGALCLRNRTSVSFGNLNISNELQAKLQDVMTARNLLTIGKVLGEGEFGSVVEGRLGHTDGTSEKVAVKTMKCVCLDVGSGHFPKPMVILPFMKHGDLHSFLLRSRLKESPFFLPTQTLLKFMVDIASGMEYLSGRNFLHRDLAARNCMLRDDMTVCVADFGLSKKIYSGDYYRQGRIAKMPVKWIAVEKSYSREDIIYINTSFPEEDPDLEEGAAAGLALSSSPSCSLEAAENTGSVGNSRSKHGSCCQDEDVELSELVSFRCPKKVEFTIHWVLKYHPCYNEYNNIEEIYEMTQQSRGESLDPKPNAPGEYIQHKHSPITCKSDLLSLPGLSVAEYNTNSTRDNVIATTWRDGPYLLVVKVISNTKEANWNLTVNVVMRGSHGYISITEWPLMIFYMVMCIVYILYALLWFIWAACYWKDLLRIQFWIAGVIFLGMVEKAVFCAEYENTNAVGSACLLIFAELVSALKRTLARLLVIIVSLGYGIIKPRLGTVMHRVVGLGVLYFAFASIEGVLRITGLFISLDCHFHIFVSLAQTIKTLKLRRNPVKLSLYRHFTNTLIFAVIGVSVFVLEGWCPTSF